MNCPQHPDTPVAAYCRTCGRGLCPACQREVRGLIYCEDCLASRVQAPLLPPSGRPGSGPHPAVAGVLAGFLPFGVGQAYNGQYARGLVYLMVFIGLIWVNNNGGVQPVFGLLIAAFYFWQLIDAIRSASCLQAGQAAPDPFGIDRLFGGVAPQGTTAVAAQPASSAPPSSALVPLEPAAYGAPRGPGADSEVHSRFGNSHSNVPLGALFLIGIGVLLLLGNVGLLQVRWAGEFWPVILIVVGGWLLAERWTLIVMGGVRGRQLLMVPAVLLALGAVFLVDNIGLIGFGRSWPLILIVIGGVLLWQRSALPLPPPAPPMSSAETPSPAAGLDDGQERQVEHE